VTTGKFKENVYASSMVNVDDFPLGETCAKIAL